MDWLGSATAWCIERAKSAVHLAAAGVIGTGTGYTPRTGSYNAWLDGYGSTHTDTLSQSVTIPSGKTSASLGFYL
jgi:hypothetical protein